MKKNLTPLLLSSVFTLAAIVPASADLIWYEGFDYPDGQIIVTSTNLAGTPSWFRHSGGGDDAFVIGQKEQIAATSSSLNYQDDVNRPFATAPGSPYTNSQIIVYASFTVNCTNLPNQSGTYFAHFKDDSVSNFVGRVFALTGDGSGAPPINFTTLPNTWRLGVSGANGAVNQVFPVDLALNTDYQVVINYDPINLYSTMWVNPTSSSDSSVATSDAIVQQSLINIQISSYALRQAGSFGNFFCTISNLAVATTFEEAATNVWKANVTVPTIAYPPANTTNYVGDDTSLSVVANGQGLTSLTYQWRKNGGNFANPNGNSPVLPFNSAGTGNSGNYDVIVTAVNGLSATSSMAFLWVTNPPVPPTISGHPTNRTVYYHQTAIFSVTAAGVDPQYQWYYNDNPAVGANFSGANTRTLTITDAFTNNNTAGTYKCIVTNIFGPTSSSNAVLTVTAAPTATIGYLRTLVDPVFFRPTNTTEYWTASGTVTTYAPLTGGANTSFYIQDDTGGIGVFIGGGAAIRPQAGENVTVTGPLSDFNGGIQFNMNVNNLATYMTTNSQGNPQPAGIVVPLSITNGIAVGGVSNLFAKVVGSVATFTNVYFVGAGGVFASGNQTDVITNLSGGTFRLFRNTAMTNLNGKPIPSHAWTVSGVMGTFLNATAPNRGEGLELFPTSYEDIVTNAPPATSGAIAVTGDNPTVNWTAQPYMSYSIFMATNVDSPYVPLATGLTFNSPSGTYTDTNDAPATRFYKIISP